MNDNIQIKYKFKNSKRRIVLPQCVLKLAFFIIPHSVLETKGTQ